MKNKFGERWMGSFQSSDENRWCLNILSHLSRTAIIEKLWDHSDYLTWPFEVFVEFPPIPRVSSRRIRTKSFSAWDYTHKEMADLAFSLGLDHKRCNGASVKSGYDLLLLCIVWTRRFVSLNKERRGWSKNERYPYAMCFCWQLKCLCRLPFCSFVVCITVLIAIH